MEQTEITIYHKDEERITPNWIQLIKRMRGVKEKIEPTPTVDYWFYSRERLYFSNIGIYYN